MKITCLALNMQSISLSRSLSRSLYLTFKSRLVSLLTQFVALQVICHDMDLPRFSDTMALAPHAFQLVPLATFGFTDDLQGPHRQQLRVSRPFCTDSSYASDDASDATDFSSAAAINQHPPTRVSRQRSVRTFKKDIDNH